MKKSMAGLGVLGVLSMCLTGCGDATTPGTDSSAAQNAAPQDDSRALADWAVVTFLKKDSTALCAVGSDHLAERFGENGWCEKDVTFTETPVKLSLVATCDATKTGGKTAPGRLYAYHVDPSITVAKDGDHEGGLVVTVDKQDGKWLVNDFYVTSLDPEDPVVGSCPYGGLKPTDEAVSLG